MRDVLNPARLGTAVAFMSATMGVGDAIGMPVAAYVAENFDWHMLFWLALALGVLGFIAVALLVPGDTLLSPGRLDIIGVIGLAAGLTGLLLFVSRGADWGWGSPAAIGSVAGGVVALALWGWYQLKTTDPLVDLRVAARPTVLLTNLAAIGVGIAFSFAAMTTEVNGHPLPTNDAFQVCFWIAIVAAVAATILTFFIPKQAPEAHASIPPREG